MANAGSITGSIGVILRGNNLSRLLERIGIQFETVKSGLYKDILSPDRALTGAERQLLQELIDSSYGQFVAAVAEGRGLEEQAVRLFADGRVFSGAQALQHGLVDQLGDEECARRLACELAELDVEKTRPISFGQPTKRFSGLIPGRNLFARLSDALHLELAWNGQPLWLHRP